MRMRSTILLIGLMLMTQVSWAATLSVPQLLEMSRQPNALKLTSEPVERGLPSGLSAYQFRVEGLAEGAECAFVSVACPGVAVERLTCRVGPGGTLLEATEKTPICCVPRGVGFGQALQYFIVYEKDNRTGRVSIIPHPFKITADAGYQAELNVCGVAAEFSVLEVRGFEANESLSVCSMSAHERIESKSMASPTGEFVCHVLPEVIGLDSGCCQFTVTGKKGTVRIDIPWGRKYTELACNQAIDDFISVPIAAYHR